jgi:hypothetical protein
MLMSFAAPSLCAQTVAAAANKSAGAAKRAENGRKQFKANMFRLLRASTNDYINNSTQTCRNVHCQSFLILTNLKESEA